MVPMIAKPRMAATAVVIDRQSNPMQVLLIKRPEYLKAFGGFLAFPGGKLDPIDYETEDQLFFGEQSVLPVDPAFYVAAARELFEEVGLLYCVNKHGEPVSNSGDWPALRSQLLSNERDFVAILKEREWFVNLPAFHYFGHRITSLQRPYRFNTRFFIVDMIQNQHLEPNAGEIETILWATPQEALDNYEKKEFKFVPPTLQSLNTLNNCDTKVLPQLPIMEYTAEYF
jgi:8-oxo-dGTP pyrophosphatase MutT (NUDIX family)